MSTSIESSQGPDPGADRAKWTQFYNELRAERDQLRKELLKMRSEYFYMYFGHGTGFYECPFTIEELHSFTSHEPSISEIIAELGGKNES